MEEISLSVILKLSLFFVEQKHKNFNYSPIDNYTKWRIDTSTIIISNLKKFASLITKISIDVVS